MKNICFMTQTDCVWIKQNIVTLQIDIALEYEHHIILIFKTFFSYNKNNNSYFMKRYPSTNCVICLEV